MPPQYTASLDAGARFLTPQVFKQAHQQHKPKKTAPRWNLHALVTVLLLMTWTTGGSEAERFATARACYVARHQHERRPGASLQGFQQALAKWPLPVLHALFAAVRLGLGQLFGPYFGRDGFVILAVDGSRQECPRSAELEQRLGQCGKNASAPMLMISALVLLPAGLLWSWAVGPGTASEHDLLRQQLPRLPHGTLLVGDAFYQGYALYQDILQTRASFLVRLSSKSQLYTDTLRPLPRFRHGLVWYWPEHAQDSQQPPLRLRLIRVRGRKKHDVWLLTDVPPRRLSRRQASAIYRLRWHVEGVFRTYKRTLPKLTLCSRTEALVYREAEVALLGLQVLQAQAARPRRSEGVAVLVLGSARQELLRLRGEITTTLGRDLGPWQQRWYREQLAQVRAGGPGRKVRRPWPRRKDHKAPKPPKLRVLPKRLKAKMAKRLKAAGDGHP